MSADWIPSMKHPPLRALSHRTLCRVAARWLLSECRYYIAGYEIQVSSVGGVLDAVAVSDPLSDVKVGRDNAERVDRQAKLALDYPGTPWAQRKPTLRRPDPRNAHVIECKVSVSDLRADLRAGKMLKYAPLANRSSVALGVGVLEAAGGIDALADLGLPVTWGVYEAAGLARAGDWTDWRLNEIRKPHRGPSMDPEPHAELAAMVGHSMTWRSLTTRIGRRENDHDGDLGP